MQLRARFVVPIATPPLQDGWVRLDDDCITAIGTGIGDASSNERDLGAVALLPGLVNAHTHLELSYLRDGVPPTSDFVAWIRGVIGARRLRPDAHAGEIMEPLQRAVIEARAAGTAAVGDISNTLAPVAPLAASQLAGVVFYELLRFNAPDPEGIVGRAVAQVRDLAPTGEIRVSLAAHAPYSVAPGILRAMRAAMDRDATLAPCSIHLAESAAEVAFLADGTGPLRRLLEDVGSWDAAWPVPGVSPVQYVTDHGLLDSRMLVVHGVHMTREDLARIAAGGATLVTCPRSNVHTGAGKPPIEAFYASGVRVAVGTDSLASAPDLNVFAELAALRALAPSIPASRLLDSATRQGARALGLGEQLGAIAPGYRARLIAVTVPPSVNDVEEYLVSGITPDQISWVA